jgi:hypothetical protein
MPRRRQEPRQDDAEHESPTLVATRMGAVALGSLGSVASRAPIATLPLRPPVTLMQYRSSSQIFGGLLQECHQQSRAYRRSIHTRNSQIAQRVDLNPIARLDHGRCVELLNDSGTLEAGANRELFAVV